MKYRKLIPLSPQPKDGVFSTGFHEKRFGCWEAILEQDDHPDPFMPGGCYAQGRFIPCPFEVSVMQWGLREVDVREIDKLYWWVGRPRRWRDRWTLFWMTWKYKLARKDDAETA
jgi:hypothetical protein